MISSGCEGVVDKDGDDIGGMIKVEGKMVVIIEMEIYATIVTVKVKFVGG